MGLAPFEEGKLGHHLTLCGLGRGLPARQVSSWSIQPFGRKYQRYRRTDRTERQSTVR